MDRKDFLKKSLLTGVLAASGAGIGKAAQHTSVYDKLMEQVGFNHLPEGQAGSPENNYSSMKTLLHKADTRGHADHGWLNSHHTFSFAGYHNPERMHFGVLRVLNDDRVAPARGFGTHPHDNMEIISIPLEGDLEHKDSMGNSAVIKQGDVQVMSAGTGIFHSEYNKNDDKEVKFLQIWVFPNKKNVAPRYDQISTADISKENQFYQVLSPNANDEGVWIHQDAWFHIGELNADIKVDYTFKKSGNGLYAFVIDGAVKIGDQQLDKRDGYGVWDTDIVSVEATEKAKVLLMEVPMSLN